MLTHLDLCSGIGGFSLASGWAGYTTIGFCEIDPFCQQVLKKHWPETPIHDDLRTLTADAVRGWAEAAYAMADANGRHDGRRAESRDGRTDRPTVCGAPRTQLVTAGYPCQPFSQAGKRLGEEDDRHLWPAIAALVAELKPAQCLFENVAGHITLGLDRVLADLEEIGYACGTVVVPACAVNAPHRRDRVWIMAHAAGGRIRCGRTSGNNGLIALRGQSGRTNWTVEPELGRVAHGIPQRVDRLRSLGNSIVPQVAYEIIQSMKEAA